MSLVPCARIDDMFVLVSILRNFLDNPTLQALSIPGDLVPKHEMRLTLALAGPSVVLTTFSVLTAFLISSLVMKPFFTASSYDFPSVQKYTLWVWDHVPHMHIFHSGNVLWAMVCFSAWISAELGPIVCNGSMGIPFIRFHTSSCLIEYGMGEKPDEILALWNRIQCRWHNGFAGKWAWLPLYTHWAWFSSSCPSWLLTPVEWRYLSLFIYCPFYLFLDLRSNQKWKSHFKK